MPEKTQLFDFRIRITVFSNKVGIANCFKCVEKIFKKLYFFDSSMYRSCNGRARTQPPFRHGVFKKRKTKKGVEFARILFFWKSNRLVRRLILPQ